MVAALVNLDLGFPDFLSAQIWEIFSGMNFDEIGEFFLVWILILKTRIGFERD